MNKLIKVTFYSAIAFAVISYITAMLSLLSTTVNQAKPITNIGFPLKYYYQFWTRGSSSPNWGWNINNFLIDCLLTWVVTVGIFYLFKIKK